jgi:hypothetical protein
MALSSFHGAMAHVGGAMPRVFCALPIKLRSKPCRQVLVFMLLLAGLSLLLGHYWICEHRNAPEIYLVSSKPCYGPGEALTVNLVVHNDSNEPVELLDPHLFLEVEVYFQGRACFIGQGQRLTDYDIISWRLEDVSVPAHGHQAVQLPLIWAGDARLSPGEYHLRYQARALYSRDLGRSNRFDVRRLRDQVLSWWGRGTVMGLGAAAWNPITCDGELSFSAVEGTVR